MSEDKLVLRLKVATRKG